MNQGALHSSAGALNRRISSPVCWTGTGLVGLETESKERIKCWLGNQHAAMRQVLNCTQRQARELISGPSPAAKTMLLSCNRTQLRVVTGRLTRHSTLTTHLYTIALTVPCAGGVENRRKPLLTFCVSAKFWRHSDILIWVQFSRTLIMLHVQVLGQSGTLLKRQGYHYLGISLRGTHSLSKAYDHRDRRATNPSSNLFSSILYASGYFYRRISYLRTACHKHYALYLAIPRGARWPSG